MIKENFRRKWWQICQILFGFSFLVMLSYNRPPESSTAAVKTPPPMVKMAQK